MMQLTLVIAFLPLIVFGRNLNVGNSELDQEWETWKSLHQKNYVSSKEESIRRLVWETNLAKVNQHNLEHDLEMHSFRLGLNHFGDLTNKEFRRMMNGFLGKLSKPSHSPMFLAPYNVTVPKSVDWRTKGYVTPVKNQGECGSCWSFSATGSLEGQHMRKTGKLVSLSEQQLVDCSTKFGNHGCNGGLMDYAFKYIKENGGIESEEDYPYKAEEDTCNFNKSEIAADDTGFVDVESGDEEALKKAVATVGPISVAIDASHVSFQMHSSGVYDEPECSPQQLDHGVLVVGYGTTEDGKDYWIVKNSWAERWGEKGYIKMARNKDNMCGIASSASYPLV